MVETLTSLHADTESSQKGDMRKTATLRDVAKVARVSFVTVSRVLNHPDKVSVETARRVRAAIKKTGYVPNLLAGGLVSNRSRLVVAVIPTFAHRPFIHTLTALGQALQAGGYQLLVCQSGYADDSELSLIESLLRRRPDAIVLTVPLRNKEARKLLQQRQIPVVETWQLHDAPIDMQVGFDHFAVGETIGAYIAARGCRTAGMIWSEDARAQLRRKGCLSALTRGGVKVTGTEYVSVPVTTRDGRQAAARLFEMKRRHDALICSIDLLAHGALIECQHRGIDVPGEVAIMGFGDLDLSADLEPGLTTVRVDAVEIGEKAAALVLARLGGAAEGQQRIDVGFAIVARRSA